MKKIFIISLLILVGTLSNIYAQNTKLRVIQSRYLGLANLIETKS